MFVAVQALRGTLWTDSGRIVTDKQLVSIGFLLGLEGFRSISTLDALT